MPGGAIEYLVHNILKRVWAVDGEANKEQIGLGVRERAQSIVLFLSSRIPEGEFDNLARGLVFAVGDVVFEDGGDVFL